MPAHRLPGDVDADASSHGVWAPCDPALRISRGDEAIVVGPVPLPLAPAEARDVAEDLGMAGGELVRGPDGVRRPGRALRHLRQRRQLAERCGRLGRERGCNPGGPPVRLRSVGHVTGRPEDQDGYKREQDRETGEHRDRRLGDRRRGAASAVPMAQGPLPGRTRPPRPHDPPPATSTRRRSPGR